VSAAHTGRLGAAILLTAGGLLALPRAHSQGLGATASHATAPFGPAMEDDRPYAHVLFHELEWRAGPTDRFRWDGEGWIGTDTQRLWLKSEGFALRGRVVDGDQELLYDRPISPYFDLQGGLRYDLDSLAGRGWAAFGFNGLAPYFFELSATLYASDAGHFAMKLRASHDELLTQRLILQPLVEINAYTRPDVPRGVGAGFSDLDVGLRLRYEISRKLAPYLGVTWQQTDRAAAHVPYTDIDTASRGGWRMALGLRAWL